MLSQGLELLRGQIESILSLRLPGLSLSFPALPISPSTAIALLLVTLLAVFNYSPLLLLLKFCYSCFLKPLGSSTTQRGRLDAFYTSQAGIYDSTRTRLLKGREEMLRLVAGHLAYQENKIGADGAHEGLVWIDVGGGTGWNIEKMSEYYDITKFRAVFLVDLCEPLLEVARERFFRLGFKNVYVLCQDANTFTLPNLPDGSTVGGIDLVTMSYSLSMIPGNYAMLDRLSSFLNPTGLVGCVDFYASEKTSKGPVTDQIGDIARHTRWWTRWFWMAWFEFDHVELHHSRRAYLEHRFATLKSLNARNDVGPLFSIPYYIWLGCKNPSPSHSLSDAHLFRHNAVTERLAAFGSDPLTPLVSPSLSATSSTSNTSSLLETIPDFSLSPALSAVSSVSSLASNAKYSPPLNGKNGKRGPSTSPTLSSSSGNSGNLERSFLAVPPPLSTFYYQTSAHRMPYSHGPEQAQFRSWIYGFTWEDPYDDIVRMGITKNSTVMCITSAGDNALHYVAEKGCKRVHCVDMNPCQGHLLELKLAGIKVLEHEEFWQLFGEGQHPAFEALLDTKLAPYLSAHAYAFWKANKDAFDYQFYAKGYSGWALRILAALFNLLGRSDALEKFANAATLEEQVHLYETTIRPLLCSGWLVRLIVSNPIFLWNTLGVPIAQLSLITSESSMRQYVVDTLDPIGYTQHIRTSNYHYYLALCKKYRKGNEPMYLTKEGFEKLKRKEKDGSSRLDAFRLHTNLFGNIVTSPIIAKDSINVWIGMDSQDWYHSNSEAHRAELSAMISSLKKCMAPGGKAFWRSAAMDPWYKVLWELQGFRVERLSVRRIGAEKPIDSVNMYASLWRAVKV